MEIKLNDIFPAVITSVLTIIPAVLFNDWLVRIGSVRRDKNSKTVIIVLALCLIFIKPLLFNSLQWWIWGIGVFLGATFSFNRADLSKTLARGRTWWKKTKPEGKK